MVRGDSVSAMLVNGRLRVPLSHFLFATHSPITPLSPENLASIIRNIPNKEQAVVLGDFNARVGADHDSWPSCVGQFGLGKMNGNGQRLLELCAFHDLCITNSFFRTVP